MFGSHLRWWDWEQQIPSSKSLVIGRSLFPGAALVCSLSVAVELGSSLIFCDAGPVLVTVLA